MSRPQHGGLLFSNQTGSTREILEVRRGEGSHRLRSTRQSTVVDRKGWSKEDCADTHPSLVGVEVQRLFDWTEVVRLRSKVPQPMEHQYDSKGRPYSLLRVVGFI